MEKTVFQNRFALFKKIEQLGFKRMKYLQIIALFTSLLISCEDDKTQPVVLTEDVLYLSGQIVRLSGRIYDDGDGKITEHGFEISLSKEFTNNVTYIELGGTDAIGQFIGSDSTLLAKQQYFYRAYTVIDGSIYYGQSKFFQTLPLNIKSFSPKKGYVGDELTIVGANFGTETQVFFNNKEAQILEIFLESIITVKVPETGPSATVEIKVSQNGKQEVFSNPFDYVTGEWKNIGSFITNQSYFETISLVSETELIYGLGNKVDGQLNENVWKLDFNTWEWSSVEYVGIGARGAFFNDSGIVSGGATLWPSDAGDYLFNDETWRYEDDELKYLTDSPLLYHAQSFVIDNESYVVGGFVDSGGGFAGPTSPSKDIYKLNNTTLNWELIGSAPILFNAKSISFTFNSEQYFLNRKGSFWKYNPSLSSWEELKNSPLDRVADGYAEVINDKIFIGGVDGSDDVWEYNVSVDSWNLKHKFPGDLTFANSAHFNYNSKLYLIRGSNRGASDQQPMEIWEFDPTQF